MKRNDSFDFSRPRRQSYAAILFFIYRFFKILIQQIWPLLLAFLFGREEFKWTLLYILGLVSFGVLLFSVLSYFKYFFYILNDELVVEKGVFQKSRMNIPFERIQTINFEQSLLHQLFNVIKVEVDTAGSKGNELSFSALGLPVANALREQVMQKKSQLRTTSATETEEMVADESSRKSELIMQLSIGELIRLGFVQNHLRSLLLIVVFFSWILDQLNDIGMDTEEYLDNIGENSLIQAQWFIIQLAIGAIFLTLLISLVRTVLKYYDFSLFRTSDGFRIEAGLLNRRQVAARDHKIQLVSWADNPLKRMLRLYDVVLRQAASVQIQQRQAIVIPGCNRQNLEQIRRYYFDDEAMAGLHTFGISPQFIRRRMLYLGWIPFLAVFGGISYFYNWPLALPVILWPLTVYLYSRTAHKRWRYSFNGELILIQYGVFGHYNKSLRLFKIQNISIEQPLYHRLRKLANITLHTASGQIQIPMIALDQAIKLTDYLLFKVESDHRPWM